MDWNSIIPYAIVLVAGALICFEGYRIFRLSITLIGASVGYLLGEYLFDLFGASMGFGDSEVAYWIVVLGCALALGGIAFSIYKKAIILVSAIIFGYYFTTNMPPIPQLENDYIGPEATNWIAGMILGLIFGILVFVIQKWAIMLFTAVAGAQIIAVTATGLLVGFKPAVNVAEKMKDYIFPGGDISSEVLMSGLFLIIFTILGFVRQFTHYRGE